MVRTEQKDDAAILRLVPKEQATRIWDTHHHKVRGCIDWPDHVWYRIPTNITRIGDTVLVRDRAWKVLPSCARLWGEEEEEGGGGIARMKEIAKQVEGEQELIVCAVACGTKTDIDKGSLTLLGLIGMAYTWCDNAKECLTRLADKGTGYHLLKHTGGSYEDNSRYPTSSYQAPTICGGYP